MSSNEEGAVEFDVALLTETISRVEDITELKIVLELMRLAATNPGAGVALSVLHEPEIVRVLAGAGSPEPGEHRVARAIDRAVADGLILRLSMGVADGQSVRLWPATPTNRELVERLRAGDDAAASELGLPAESDVSVFRPNVFSLYEQYIGPLTPLVADQLRDAERAYPRNWIEQALRAAAEYNRRNWRYVQTILNRWEEQGAPDATLRRRR